MKVTLMNELCESAMNSNKLSKLTIIDNWKMRVLLKAMIT